MLRNVDNSLLRPTLGRYQIIEEKKLPDGTMQCILHKRGSKIGLIFCGAILFLLFVTSIVFLVFLDYFLKELLLVMLIILMVFYPYLSEDQTKLIVSLSKKGFVLEKMMGHKKRFLYRIPFDQIEIFVFEPSIGFRSIGSNYIRNYQVSKYSGSVYDALRYSVGLRYVYKKTRMINMFYGNSDERRFLKDSLNGNLYELRES